MQGQDATALIDSTDPALTAELMEQLKDVDQIDYIVSQHSEQDHAGALPVLVERYPSAKVICNQKARDMLTSHLHLPEDRIQLVEDGETLALGGKTLTFVFTPWVHWPETFCTVVPEDKLLFSCDFFGSHLATTDLFVTDQALVYEAAKRYYAEIMMPFRKTIVKNLEKLAEHEFDMIAPSHGPVYDDPGFILDAYRDWTSPQMKNEVVGTVLHKGLPDSGALAQLDALAAAIAKAHAADENVQTD